MPNPIASPCPAAPAISEPAANPGSAPAASDASFAKTLQGQTAKASAADNGGTQPTVASAAPGPKNAAPAAAESPSATASTTVPDQAAGAQVADAIAAILALLRPQAKAIAATPAPNTVKPANDAATSPIDNGAPHPDAPPSADMAAAAAANAAWAMTVTAPTQTSSAAVPQPNAATPANSDHADLPANLAAGETKQANTAPASHGGATLPVVTANVNANANADGDVNGSSGFQAMLTAVAGHESTTPASIPAAALASAAASAAAHSAAPAAPTQHSQPVLNVASPVGSASWSSEVGNRLNWMIGHQEQRADLVLNPPHLGRIEVSLSLNGDQASALFVSANPAVRDAISNAIPQLREQMAAFGVSLGQTQVGADSAGQSAQQQGSGSWRGSDGHAGEVATTGTAASAWLARGRGLVDTFA